MGEEKPGRFKRPQKVHPMMPCACEMGVCAAQAIKSMCREIGITRNDTEIPLHKLDHHIRADLDGTSERVLAVLRPLRLVLTNLPENHSQSVDAKVCHISDGCL